MDSLVRRPGKDLARSPSSRVAGLALINEELAHLAPAMATADLCRWRLDTGDHTYLGCERSLEAKFLDRAKALHSRWLPDYAEAEAAHIRLSDDELSAVMAAARPLDVRVRDAFLQQVANELPRCDEVGPGVVHRICAAAQRQFFDAPDLSVGAAGRSSKYR